MGSVKDRITSYFVGGGLQLKNPDLFNSSSVDELFRLKTLSMGKVNLRLNIILRNFEKYGAEL
jgi:B9 domain-containing protein 2